MGILLVLALACLAHAQSSTKSITLEGWVYGDRIEAKRVAGLCGFAAATSSAGRSSGSCGQSGPSEQCQEKSAQAEGTPRGGRYVIPEKFEWKGDDYFLPGTDLKWGVMRVDNPETLKDHTCRHVKVKATIVRRDEEKKVTIINVEKVERVD